MRPFYISNHSRSAIRQENGDCFDMPIVPLTCMTLRSTGIVSVDSPLRIACPSHNDTSSNNGSVAICTVVH